jgi:Fur family ferric uptake transcriptional regulator
VFDLHGCVEDLEALAPANFQVQRHEIILYGICAACADGVGLPPPEVEESGY